MRLTGFGEEFAAGVSTVLQAVDELGDLVPTARDRLVGRLWDLHLRLDIHVRETLTPRLLGELSDGQLDCAILTLPVSDPVLTEVALFSEAMGLVRPASDARRATVDDLHGERLLLLEEGHCFRDQALSLCHIGAARRGPGRGWMAAHSRRWCRWWAQASA